ncbi:MULTISPECIES: hypothetical protein [Sorangium]|nr:hypothetical protein [Sorangium cellulosum]
MTRVAPVAIGAKSKRGAYRAVGDPEPRALKSTVLRGKALGDAA